MEVFKNIAIENRNITSLLGRYFQTTHEDKE